MSSNQLLQMQRALHPLLKCPSKQMVSLISGYGSASMHQRYNRDWLQLYKGSAEIILKPETTDEVSNILRTCNEEKWKIQVQGGNTGLVGGSIALNDTRLLMSMERMSGIRAFDSASGTLHCQAGSVLESLQDEINSQGWRVPLDLGSKGSCQIGGNIATAAGGTRFCKFGSFHANLLGLKYVLPTGRVVNDLSGFQKDNTGIHLKHLMVGSEGILGVITEAMLQCHRIRKHNRVCFLTLNPAKGVDALPELIATAKQHALGEFICAFEMIDDHCIGLHRSLHSHTPLFDQLKVGTFNVLMECEFDDEQYLQELVFDFISQHSSSSDSLLIGGVIAANEAQAKDMWHIRETITLNLVTNPAKRLYKFDVSIHLSDLAELQATLATHADLEEIYYFGHCFDENVHINILTTKHNIPEGTVEGLVYEAVHKCNGSFSAEHGIGSMKKKYLEQYDVKNQMDTLRMLKRAFDPNLILNADVMV